jgi:hypothetical protein
MRLRGSSPKGRQFKSAPRHGRHSYCAVIPPSTVRIVLVVHAAVVEVVHELKGGTETRGARRTMCRDDA